MKKPKITSEWKTLFKPRLYGRYVNDHTLIYNGQWHLIGIQAKKGSRHRNDILYMRTVTA